MRGELCIGSASFLSFAAVLLLIFLHLGQINTSTIPRGIAMIQVNMSGYGDGLATALGDPINGLYTTNASAPLQQRAGLRQSYQFGLYSYCAYVDPILGDCSNRTVAQKFQPFNVITSDMFTNYSQLTNEIISGTPVTFQNSAYLGQYSSAAYYMLLIGSICAALAMCTGIIKHNVAFLLSTLFAMLGSLLLLIGAVIWTVLIEKTKNINLMVIGSASLPIGIVVSMGTGIFLAWTAFACLVVSILPYMISCCTYRG